jgi:hypothetical protein
MPFGISDGTCKYIKHCHSIESEHLGYIIQIYQQISIMMYSTKMLYSLNENSFYTNIMYGGREL